MRLGIDINLTFVNWEEYNGTTTVNEGEKTHDPPHSPIWLKFEQLQTMGNFCLIHKLQM